MIMITELPTEINIVSSCIACDRLFISTNDNAKSRTDCRDAPRCIRRFPNTNNSVYVIGHYNKQGHLKV